MIQRQLNHNYIAQIRNKLTLIRNSLTEQNNSNRQVSIKASKY
ncbi:MAG: hypothetical protein ACI9LE_000012 [Paraglaciecola sp.]|jgi:hypothetical protein